MGSKGLKFLVASNTHMFLYLSGLPSRAKQRVPNFCLPENGKKGVKNEDDIEVTTGHAHRIKSICSRRKIYEHSKGSWLTDYSDHSNMLAIQLSFPPYLTLENSMLVSTYVHFNSCEG